MSEPVPQPEPEERVVTGRGRVVVRRAPRITRFMTVGAALGGVVAIALALLFPETAEFPRGQVFGFLLLGMVPVGAAILAAVALVIETRSNRRAREVDAERETGSDG